MNKEDFITLFIDELEIEGVITESTELSSIEEFDSVGRMILIGFADEKLGKKLSSNEINTFKNMSDLMNFLEVK